MAFFRSGVSISQGGRSLPRCSCLFDLGFLLNSKGGAMQDFLRISPRRVSDENLWGIFSGCFRTNPLHSSGKRIFPESWNSESTFRIGSQNPLWEVLGAYPWGPSLGGPVRWGGSISVRWGGDYHSAAKAQVLQLTYQAWKTPELPLTAAYQPPHVISVPPFWCP